LILLENTQQNNLKRKYLFRLVFQKVPSMYVWPHALGENIMQRECVVEEVFHFMIDRKQ
jgi:hypothetical protein